MKTLTSEEVAQASREAREPVLLEWEPTEGEYGEPIGGGTSEYPNARAAARDIRHLFRCHGGSCEQSIDFGDPAIRWTDCLQCALEGDDVSAWIAGADRIAEYREAQGAEEYAPVSAEEWDRAREHGRTVPIRSCGCIDYPCCVHADDVAVIL